MFSKLISRNSRRNRRENGLFFSSLLVSVAAFYIILSLPRQDVMLFLQKMESDAVNKLFSMIPLLYGMALFLLFFLIFYAGKFQLERRRHEFGVYLMLGMRRGRLFFLLLAEDLRGSVVSLLIGLPAAVLLSELVSLITARLVGIGIIGHQTSFSPQAALWTAAGFLLIKLAAFLILSGKISRQEIDSLMTDLPEEGILPKKSVVYLCALTAGLLCLSYAYRNGISGRAWSGVKPMALTVIPGLAGTFLLFYGLRLAVGFLAGRPGGGRGLRRFHFRQIEETVIRRSGTLAVCSLLILCSLCCFGAGVAIARFYGDSEPHVLDYTFRVGGDIRGADDIRHIMAGHGLADRFSLLFEMKVGHIRAAADREQAFRMEPLMAALEKMPPSQDRNVLLNNLSYADYPYLISLSGYNRLLAAAGLPELSLDAGEAAVYMDSEYVSPAKTRMLNRILETEPVAQLAGDPCRLTGTVQTVNLVTDRSITLSFALIVPDEAFEACTQGEISVYVNAVLADKGGQNASLMSVISDTNRELERTGLSFESYLQNMGRQLFFMAASSYITIYLAVIFLLIANTVIGVHFLMSQRMSNRRYRTLIRLGADHKTLCGCAGKQIRWYFGIPTSVAVLSSLFGVRSLLVGLLPSRAHGNLSEMMILSAAMILALSVIECIYIAAVKRSSDRYLLTLMVPRREE